MKKLFLAAGVAALAIAAPSGAKPGEGKGGGNGGGQPKAERGGGGGHGGGSRMEKRGGGGDQRAFKMERRGGGERRAFAQPRFERAQKQERRFEARNHFTQRVEHGKKARDNGFKDRDRFAEVRSKQRERVFKDRSKNSQRLVEQRIDRDRDNRLVALRDWNDGDRWDNVRSFSDGCPPGLARKNNGCLPPGQAKKLIGSMIPAAYASGYLPTALRDLYRDDDDRYYRYGDGYLYEVDRRSNLVNSLLPLFGGGYTVGQQFPMDYSGYMMPSAYQPFYQDNPYDYYRYNNGYVYDIDRRSGLIENIIPALGYGYGVGEMLPASYSAYNLPYQYRDVYSDNDDYYYRYAPGAIYQVDRDSSLITSVASLLTGGMGVGQQLPMGYSAYNVPYAYRDQYYDTPDNMYRYANGNIYQVDPTTQLITAVISALV